MPNSFLFRNLKLKISNTFTKRAKKSKGIFSDVVIPSFINMLVQKAITIFFFKKKKSKLEELLYKEINFITFRYVIQQWEKIYHFKYCRFLCKCVSAHLVTAIACGNPG